MPNALQRPLLTIAVPTYNRDTCLRQFLETLVPQIDGRTDVEFFVADNASTDGTLDVLNEFAQRCPALRIIVRAENIGSDANFVSCFREARGKYFWLCGDDDIIRPGAIDSILSHLKQADYDLVYLGTSTFVKDWKAEFTPDIYGRTSQVITSSTEMARTMNVMVTFITCMISNRERFLSLNVAPPEETLGSHLTQLSWTLPLLSRHRQSLCLWERWVCGRAMNSGGYDVAHVFGEQLNDLAKQLLPENRDIAKALSNYALRCWFPNTIAEIREGTAGAATERNEGLEASSRILRRRFGRNPRFWFFIWPVLKLPPRWARRWERFGAKVNHGLNAILNPIGAVRKIASSLKRR